ncbi:MAG TPA: SH3 domain-containing protein [Candidatus Polarisedimenticolia bacterium]|nr:SH3 domain-containing protein [Candidatus Polarisedimenticolia bacterium]
MKQRLSLIAAGVTLLAIFAFTPSARADAVRGTIVHEETIRVAPSGDAARVGDVKRGNELIIIATSRDWVQVEAILRAPSNEEGATEDEAEGKAITGWVPNRSLVRSTTQDGDRIIFGEAADSEDQASRRRGRRDAAQDAMRLYYRVYDLMPASPLAAEALYRAADIRWQIERSDVMTRPSARERDAYMRGQMKEEWMKLAIKKYPGTKWADLAAFRLLENKLCGDWEGLSKCPEKEAEIYENYVKDHPQSPAAAEALYNAAWRRAALIEIYKIEPNQKKSAEAKDRALSLAQKVVSQYGQSDWAYRAQRLSFYIQQGIATYGNASD